VSGFVTRGGISQDATKIGRLFILMMSGDLPGH